MYYVFRKKNMVSVFSSWVFWVYICNVQKSQAVRLYANRIETQSTRITTFQPSVISKTCLLNPDAGPCRSKLQMWYYNPASNNCSIFEWGGCQGNGNRFDTFPECWVFCMSKPGSRKYHPRHCALSFDYGYCFGAVERWYYDPVWKVCKTTIYSGCGGNKNNFYNQEQCETMCRFGNAAITTKATTKAMVNVTRKVLIINPLSKTPEPNYNENTKPPPPSTTAAGNFI